MSRETFGDDYPRYYRLVVFSLSLELLLTLANLGHYNLFNKGILHRNISSGSILCYSDPIERPALDRYYSSFIAFISLILIYSSRFECTRNVTYCRGFLIDGDHAIKWRELSNSQSISVCGCCLFEPPRRMPCF